MIEDEDIQCDKSYFNKAHFSDAPSMKKEKKRKSKKDKEAENVDSDEGKKRRESQSSQGSISPKLRVFHYPL